MSNARSMRRAYPQHSHGQCTYVTNERYLRTGVLSTSEMSPYVSRAGGHTEFDDSGFRVSRQEATA